jgi:lantibiotic modifying enzyme
MAQRCDGNCGCGDLFEAERHHATTSVSWNDDVALETIRHIVRDFEDRFDPDIVAWPRHRIYYQVPLRDEGIYSGVSDPIWWLYSLYSGSAGIILGLEYLRERGVVSLRRNYSQFMSEVLKQFMAALGSESDLSYFVGLCGILAVKWGLERSDFNRSQLVDVVRRNLWHSSEDLFWGCAGSLLAASFVAGTSLQPELAEIMRLEIERLLDTWRYEPEFGCHLWTQHIDGHYVKHLGAAHGLAGNVFAMVRCINLLGPRFEVWAKEIDRRYVRSLQNTGKFVGNHLVNWPQSVGAARPGRTAMLVQWCHGAPGIISCSPKGQPGRYDSLEAILAAAGELVWQAGPLTKTLGGLCHGSAGNGFALLSLYERTGKPSWLHRARAFGVSCIKDYSESYRLYGQSKYSLFTGDLGVAIFLLACIRKSASMLSLQII